MAYDETLATKVRQILCRRPGLAEKKMFGGLGFLIGGNMAVGVWKEFLILRLGLDGARQVLGEEHARPFDVTGKPLRGWAMIEPEGWRAAPQLRRWVTWAADFAESLPPK